MWVWEGSVMMRYEYYEEKGESWHARLKSRAVISIPNIVRHIGMKAMEVMKC